MGTYSREEIEQAFQTFQDRAKVAGKSHDWTEWSECFTEDADYYEHHYGRMKGRAAILEWIQSTMNEPLFAEMTEFPIDWYMIDEERGWIMCQVANVMDDPGDGSDHREYNWTLLKYAGNGQFSYEEDMYNPNEFGAMVKGYLDAKKKAARAAEGGGSKLERVAFFRGRAYDPPVLRVGAGAVAWSSGSSTASTRRGSRTRASTTSGRSSTSG